MPKETEVSASILDELDDIAGQPSVPHAQRGDLDLTERESGDTFKTPKVKGGGGSGAPKWGAKLPDMNPAELDKLELLKRQKEREMENDSLVQASEHSADTSFLDLVIQELVKEIASLTFERKQFESMGMETAAISTRKVAALKSLADTWAQRRKMFNDSGIDLHSEKFQNVVEYLLEVFRDTMIETGLPNTTVVEVFEKLMSNLDGWEDKAKERLLMMPTPSPTAPSVKKKKKVV